MCGYDCTGCGACYDKEKSLGKHARVIPRGRCAACGKQNAPSASVCTGCGSKLDPYRTQRSQRPLS